VQQQPWEGLEIQTRNEGIWSTLPTAADTSKDAQQKLQPYIQQQRQLQLQQWPPIQLQRLLQIHPLSTWLDPQ
jgi:hypothetical protein